MEIILTFNTTGHAIKAEKLLLENGLKVKIRPLPIKLGDGCGLCLSLENKDLRLAKNILNEAKICPQAFLKSCESGQVLYSAI